MVNYMIAEKKVEKLIIIKELYSHGEKHSFYDTRLDRRLAIISFHNAIELFLRLAILTKNSSNADLDKKRFEGKITEFKSKVIPKDDIIFEAELIDLNVIRNKIYHNYTIPTQDETENFKVTVRLFLKHFIPKVFKVTFDELSLFDMDTIRNPFVSCAYAKGIAKFASEYNESMSYFQKAFNEQFNSVYGNPINIGVNFSNSDNNPEIISLIDRLAFDIDVSFKTIQKHIVDKHHFKLKDWVDTIYHGYAVEDVNFKDLTKMRLKLEEFIAETDHYILDDYLEGRKRNYHDMENWEKKYGFPLIC